MNDESQEIIAKHPWRRIDDRPIPESGLDNVGINAKSHNLLRLILSENPKLREILRTSTNEVEALVGVKEWIFTFLQDNPEAMAVYKGQRDMNPSGDQLRWSDYAAIRILDYIDHAGREYEDLNLRGQKAHSNPVKMLWLAVRHGTGGAKPFFFEDMLHLFRQLTGKTTRKLPVPREVKEWMKRWPSGLDPRIVTLREENKERILNIIIDRIDNGQIESHRFKFPPDMGRDEKYALALKWWDDFQFHLGLAIRSPELLNEMLGNSLDPDAMKLLYKAAKLGIPFFVNPYYLSLLHVRVPYFAVGADQALRDYVLYSRQLVEEFGNIVAWEKEDKVEEGKPNAAGWLLPTATNVHRRYPEVAILIPDTVGRACGGLCASCQRMYDFQRGNLNFNLEKLEPKETWPVKLRKLMDYFENDSQLRDILITGGDALMSADKSLEGLLDAIYDMAKRKIEANQNRPEGEKYAEILRVRLGTRLPVYIPQRITDNLVRILSEFKSRASQIGIKQFVIQTHFISPMEVTPEAEEAVGKLLSAGWMVTNQHVMVASSSRRGHTAKLRKALNSIGVLCYYTFSVKGYMENQHSFATNARTVQEQVEEKVAGNVPGQFVSKVRRLPLETDGMKSRIKDILNSAGLPFLATDRSVLNLPGVGKSLSFRVVGITRYGRRILQFEHDSTRRHSPIIDKLGKVYVVESKSISEYLNQLQEMGEDPAEYQSIWGYSMGHTEERTSIFEYPGYDFGVTEKFTNLVID